MNGGDATKILKRELRKRIRSSLSALPDSEIRRESKLLTSRILQTPQYQSANSVALYASMPQELDTSELIRASFEHEKRVFLPRVVDKKLHKMVMLECKSMAELESWTPNDWNIREPPLEPSRMKTPEDVPVQVILVPGVAFDLTGRRCGQGMGFYDRFLHSCDQSPFPMPYLLAAPLSVQIVDHVPVDETDWCIDQVVVCDESVRAESVHG